MPKLRKVDLSKRTPINLAKPPEFGELPRKPDPPRPAPMPWVGTTDPQQGLVPFFGTDIYTTPEEPAEIDDCDRYPDSILCGGNPFSFSLIDLEIQIVQSECDLGIEFQPTFGFIKAPRLQIVHRSPNCRPPSNLPELPPSTIASPPPALPAFGDNDFVVLVFGLERSVVATGNYSDDFRRKNILKTLYCQNTVHAITVFRTEQSHNGVDQSDPNPNNLRYPNSFMEGQPRLAIYEGLKPLGYIQTNTLGAEAVIFIGLFKWIKGLIYQRYTFSTAGTDLAPRNPTQMPGIYNFIPAKTVTVRQRATTKGIPFTETTTRIWTLQKGVKYVAGSPPVCTEAPRPIIPPPPPRPCKPCMNCCCNSKQSPDDPQLNRLLSLKLDNLKKQLEDLNKKLGTFPRNINIYDEKETQQGAQNKTLTVNSLGDAVHLAVDRVEVTSKVLGIEEFPASVPASLISKDEGFLGNLLPNPNINIANLTALVGWYVERFDEVMGQFEIAIEIKDSDPATPGEQPVGVKLPNVAESIGEMMGLLMQQSINSEILVNMAVRNLTTGGLIQKQGYESGTMLEAILDYLNFKTEEKAEEIGLLFTPGKSKLEELLKEYQLKVKATNCVDKTTLKDTFHDLLHAAAIIRALNWRQLDPNSDIASQVMAIVKGFQDKNKEINKDKDEEIKEADFDRFLEDAELGFTNYAGITDPLNPYGKPYAQRPRIRKLGNAADTPPEGP